MRPFITSLKCVLQRRVKQMTLLPDRPEKPTFRARQVNQVSQQKRERELSVTGAPHSHRLNAVDGKR